MSNWRTLSWKHLFALLLILHILPLWIFAYFPSQDGASHVYNALVLKEYSQHENFKMRDAWQLNITIFPNWLSHIALAALLYIFPPVLSEKIFLTIAIGMIPIAFFYFLHAVNKEHKQKYMYAWLGFPFAYNYLLYMGFYNFTLSIAFFFFSFGYWWKHKDNMRIKHLSILYILLLLTYLSHIASYGLVVLGISVAAGCIWGCEALLEAWKARRENTTAIIKKFYNNLKPFYSFLLYMVPIYFILMEYYLQSIKRHPTGGHRGFEWLKDYFWGVKSLVYFTDWHLSVNYFLLVVFGVAIVISIAYRIAQKQWIKQTDVFLLIAILFTYMYFKAPWSYGPGGWINDRIHIYILLMLAPWLIIPDVKKTYDLEQEPSQQEVQLGSISIMHKFIRYAITTCLLLFTLLHFGRTALDHGRISTEIAELVSGAKLIEPHTTFNHRTGGWHKSKFEFDHYNYGEKKMEKQNAIKYVTPFVHSTAFYGVYADDVVHMANYEANYYYFPVNRNNRKSVGLGYIRADYVVAWYYPETETFADLTPNYDLIYETERLKLFRRKTQETQLNLWDRTEDGNLIIRFDMQPDNAVVEEGYYKVAPKTMYVSGKYGWDTEWNPTDESNKDNWRITPRASYSGSEGQSPLTRDAVYGMEDAAFRIDLPNGTYRVTNFFQSPEAATHEVNMLANGKPIIKKLIVPPHDELAEKVATVEVENGYLVLVIYTPKKRYQTNERHIHWVWNGCIVEQIAAAEED